MAVLLKLFNNGSTLEINYYNNISRGNVSQKSKKSKLHQIKNFLGWINLE